MRLAHGCAPAVLWALLLLLAPGHRAGATFPAETTLSAAATEGASAGAAPALAGPLLWQPRDSPLEEAARSRAAGRPAPPAPLNEAAFAAAHADVPWALMYTMRNRVAHGYFKVDYELVWKTIYADLPDLRAQVARLIAP